MDLTKDELLEIEDSILAGGIYDNKEKDFLLKKIQAEIERKSELENLDFEDCDGCKL